MIEREKMLISPTYQNRQQFMPHKKQTVLL